MKPLLPCLLLILSSPLLAFDCSNNPVISYQNNEGKGLGIYISEDAIAQTQQWSPAIDPLPVSIKDIVLKIEEWSAKHFPDHDRVVVDSIAITSYKCPQVIARWFYLLSVVPVVNGEKDYPSYQPVAVLFDGTTIAATQLKTNNN